MRRVHEMPFGATFAQEGTRFGLWAPAAPRVGLVLGRDAAREIPMRSEGDGWHSVSVEGLAPGTAYAYRVDDGDPVPDPASRSQPWDAKGPSAIVDPRGFEWSDEAWRGRPWHEAVVYELHLGTLTPAGTYRAAIEKLDHVARLGATAIELMPLAEFAGARGWGYDGVLPFAPESAYGPPEDLKRLVQEAHARGLMVLLDVVYNHFGPEGNHLSRYAPQFFNPAHQTPWGAAINFDGERSRVVRDFFLHNALYWVEEYHLDGLRMDAIHAIADDSQPHIVAEIAAVLAAGPGTRGHVHLVLENDRNEAGLLRGERGATAQWNDDWHHAAHVIATGERDGYYAEYAPHPVGHLGRALAEGFAWQGEASPHRKGASRGERSAHLPPTAFMPFLQNHDQIGNRALGERIGSLARPRALRLVIATQLLSPAVPLLFMGEEFAASSPFLYFCDFEGELARAVREGRRREFAAFARFEDARERERIPDPNAPETFQRSKLDWSEVVHGEHAERLALYWKLLGIRERSLVPHLAHEGTAAGRFETRGEGGLMVDWTLGDGVRLHLRANFADERAPIAAAPGTTLHVEGAGHGAADLAPWSGAWTLEAP